jgi:hypothetical protein
MTIAPRFSAGDVMNNNPNSYRASRFAGILLLILAGGATQMMGQVQFRVLSYLKGYGGPALLNEASPGLFYGQMNVLPTGEVAFTITSRGAITILATWPSGYVISSPLIMGHNGRAYSVLGFSTNPESAFSVTPKSGSLVTYPPQSFEFVLTQSLPDGDFLGFADSLGLYPYYVIRMDLRGAVAPVYQFPVSYAPIGAPIYASDGNYYGISSNGYGPDSYLFRLTPSGTLTKVYNFPSNAFKGAGGDLPLFQASDGNLYSLIPNGGANANGLIYKLTLSGQYTPVYTFPAGKSGWPSTLIEGSDGNLYGATSFENPGILFQVTTSGQYRPLYTIGGRLGLCQCWLTQGSDGQIYGTAGYSIYALNLGLPKPAPRAARFDPKSGAVGTKVRIWGYNLLSASVQFNGVPAASVRNSGPNYVLATVPAGATTGPITVTTPGGTFTTRQGFTVQ